MNHFKEAKKERNTIAAERIKILLDNAKNIVKSEDKLAKRYVELARKLQTKYNIKLTSSQKRSFCKECNTFFIPSVNCRVRLTGQNIVYTCSNCKAYSKFRYKK